MQKKFLAFLFLYYIYYDDMKMKTRRVPAVDDLCTSTGTQNTALGSIGVGHPDELLLDKERFLL